MPRAFRQTISPLLALLCGILKPGFGSIHATNPLRSQTARSCPCLRPSTTPLKRLIQGLMQIISGEGHLVIGYCAFSILCAGMFSCRPLALPPRNRHGPQKTQDMADRTRSWDRALVHPTSGMRLSRRYSSRQRRCRCRGPLDQLLHINSNCPILARTNFFPRDQPLPYGIGMPASRANWTSSGSCHPVRT